MLSQGDPIPRDNNIARWCRESSIKGDRVTSAAFFSRQHEAFLSGNWLEFFSLDPDNAVKDLITSLTALRLNKRQRFVRLSAGDFADAIIAHGGNNPCVLFSPEQHNPSHVAMSWDHFPRNEQIIAAALLIRALENPVYDPD